ncbi:MAG TPA: aldose epimerase family protein [Bacteroidota bacterium]|nr:aldose epimerase family protein [Bacteroidota bacterium]
MRSALVSAFCLLCLTVPQLIARTAPMNLQTATRTPSVRKEPFGRLPDGTAVDLYTMTASSGMEARVMTYGGIIVSLRVPDRQGNLDDVVLGFDSLRQYVEDSPYFGAIVGRYGNRIAKGSFTLNGKTYRLAVNNGKNHLHGGLRGFDKAVWNAVPAVDGDTVSLTLTYTSKNLEEGYPGTLTTRVIYQLTPHNRLRIVYRAATDAPTVVNLTQHSYFNLAGAGTGDILAHLMTIAADRYTPVDSGLIPTGELAPVEGTPFDFRKPQAIGLRIGQRDPQLERAGGYDHNFVLNGGPGLKFAARVEEPGSGRVMEVYTTEPGLQFYSGNFLDGHLTGKAGRRYLHRYGFCLETQHFPDSPNHPSFPTTTLLPGAEYRTETVYAFSAEPRR